MPTLKQERLAKLDPDKFETKRDMVRAAGYAESTAIARPGKVSAAIGVQRAREARRGEIRDNASRIDDAISGASKALRSIQWDQLSPQDVITALGLLGKTKQTMIESGDLNADVDQGQLESYRDKYRRALRRRTVYALSLALRDGERAARYLEAFRAVVANEADSSRSTPTFDAYPHAQDVEYEVLTEPASDKGHYVNRKSDAKVEG